MQLDGRVDAQVPVQLDALRFQVLEATLLSVQNNDGIGHDQTTVSQILKNRRTS